MAKLIKVQEIQEDFLKELKADVSGVTQKVKAYSTIIKQLEQRYGQISVTLVQCSTGALPSVNVLNPPTLVHYLTINTRSDSPPDEHLLRTTNEPKKKNIVAD